MALEREIAAFEASRGNLEAGHSGEWVLIHDTEIVGLFLDFDSAATKAVERFGRGPYLIRQVGAPPVVIPASAMFVFQHA